jgi:DNA-binding IclR family transcriptional regulator
LPVKCPDAYGLAAPFFEGPQVAGSVTLTIPRFRKDELDLRRLTPVLGRTAARISALLTV